VLVFIVFPVFVFEKSRAMLNNGTVIYTPFWHPMLPGWQKVDAAILRNATAELERLQEEAGCGHRRL
jgi:hypothetical protein